MRKLFLSGMIAVSAASTNAWAFGDEYLTKVREDYEDILVVKVQSARSVHTPDGHHCFYSFDAKALDVVRGKFSDTHLNFSSEVGLTVGDQYLVYFSKEDALVHRYGAGARPGSVAAQCAGMIKGYHLLYNEIHHKVREWNGARFTEMIEFSDPWASVDSRPGIKIGTAQLNDWGYIRKQLSY